MPNLKVEIHFPSEEQKEEFVDMLAWMETCDCRDDKLTVYFQTEHEQKKYKKICESMKGES